MVITNFNGAGIGFGMLISSSPFLNFIHSFTFSNLYLIHAVFCFCFAGFGVGCGFGVGWGFGGPFQSSL